MTAAQREFDIVLYGATGFVGKLTAEYLARAGGDARIALAGRSPDKLLAVRDALGNKAQSWELITADASQPSTLNAMAARTRVVVTTVGPYLKYGLPLVAACAAAGTDYADLTGEALFIRDSIDLYHKQAVDTGARIVHSCGFDSIPSDLTVFALYRRAEQDEGRDDQGASQGSQCHTRSQGPRPHPVEGQSDGDGSPVNQRRAEEAQIGRFLLVVAIPGCAGHDHGVRNPAIESGEFRRPPARSIF